MNIKNFQKTLLNKNTIFLVFYLTILIGFYYDEDALGGAKHDFLNLYRIVERFNINFIETFLNYGNPDLDLPTRNSPIFLIILSFLNKVIPIEILRLINSGVSLLIGIYFFKCLKIKFKDQKEITLILLSSIIFLSPTIRSLSIWPYSLIWGLLFFIISIYNFLKFKDCKNKYDKFIFSLRFLFFLILSSYIWPSLSVFIIFYVFHLFEEFKVSKNLFFLFLYCLVLSIPFLLYIYSFDVFKIFYSAEGVNVDLSQSLNLSNKIIIIATMFLYFTLPILNFKIIYQKIKLIEIKPIIIILFFVVINIYYFNFLYFKGGGFGGGFFHKLSHLIFNNNFLTYCSFIFSIILIYVIFLKDKNKNNFILLIILVLTNPQFTIYNKYFDPLIIIVLLTIFDLDLKKHFFKKKYRFIQLYYFSIFYLVVSLLKSYVL